ncbi:hypothetical protein [Sinosporangium siamense]|nr:hypothetical protein [Sinosporangium siamense]
MSSRAAVSGEHQRQELAFVLGQRLQFRRRPDDPRPVILGETVTGPA